MYACGLREKERERERTRGVVNAPMRNLRPGAKLRARVYVHFLFFYVSKSGIEWSGIAVGRADGRVEYQRTGLVITFN